MYEEEFMFGSPIFDLAEEEDEATDEEDEEDPLDDELADEDEMAAFGGDDSE